LREFDWELLRNVKTIGCNSAFILGAGIIDVLLFADWVWWDKIGLKGTEEFGGIVVACSPRLHNSTCPWLHLMERHESKRGLSRTKLSFCGNTGAMAINLALILGARRVFLLGFDMMLGKENKPNWHDLRYEGGREEVYRRFIKQMQPIVTTLPTVFPGCEVINVTDRSNLDLFPKVSLEEHFQLQGKVVA